jgi:lipid-binding SYLF domain-containing protein
MLGKIAASVVFALVLTLIGTAPAAAKDAKEEQRAAVRKSSQQILNQLYRVRPSAKGAVASAAGYAVFSNFGMKLFLAGGGSGSGMAVNNASKKEVFMKMVEVQAGLGFGIKKFRVVFIFETQSAFNEFVNSGWEFGGQATAAASYGKQGSAYQGAASVMPGVWIYQMTDEGLALELTGKGTKYYKNDELN